MSNERTLYFVLNQDPGDGSAHGLYAARHLSAMEAMAPENWTVRLVCPSGASNLPCRNSVLLPSLRRGNNPLRLHANAVFHRAAWWNLSKRAKPVDVIATASFPRLFEFLASRFRKREQRPRLVYEVHQLESLSRPASHPKCRQESHALAMADLLFATTIPLEHMLGRLVPGIPIKRVGLAAGYGPVPRPPSKSDRFRVGYFGSVSLEQGIPWLVDTWKTGTLGAKGLDLHIYGRTRRGETPPASDPDNRIFVHEPVAPEQVPEKCGSLDALIIPALNTAHRPSIAFTKAYDYIGLGLPLVTSDLPTIREVIRPDVDGLLFQPGDASAMMNQLLRLSRAPELCVSLTNNARHRGAELSWNDRATRWWEALTSA